MTKKLLFIFMMLFGGVSLLQAATIPLSVGIVLQKNRPSVI